MAKKQRNETTHFEKPLLKQAQKELVVLSEKTVGMSQSDIAAKLGCAPQHVFRALKEGVPTLRFVTGIAKVLGYDVQLSLVKRGSKKPKAAKPSKASKPSKPKAAKATEAPKAPETADAPKG